MQSHHSILIADLAGYTAMTDIHGGEKAADVVFKFTEIAINSLIHPCELHESVGDEILITSADSDSLLLTIMQIYNKIHTDTEFNLLNIHAGLHRGEIHKSSGLLFGTAINLTSRIAGHARQGQILCSRQFKEDLADSDSFRFKELGEVNFKNLKNPREIYEVSNKHSPPASHHAIDPVCKMHLIVDKETLTTFYDNESYYFCSTKCLSHFKEDPDYYRLR